MKKIVFTFCVVLASAGLALAHNTPKKGNPSNPGNGDDSVIPKDNHPKVVVLPGKTNPTPKQKIVIPVKKESAYELKALSIFTFTVLNTYFQKK